MKNIIKIDSRKKKIMMEIKVRCPCCDNNLILKFDDTNQFVGVFFNEIKISEDEAFEQYGICLGEKGGEDIAE